MKKILGALFILAGILGGFYVGGWMLFVSPIIMACKAFDTGVLTATIVGWTIIKCILAGFVGWGIAYLGIIIGQLFLFSTIRK